MKNYNLKLKKFAFCIVILIFTFLFFNSINAATNVSSTNFRAWNDNIGWIDFYSTNNVNVSSAKLTGYASSSVGYIALDCATSPNGDICATSNFKISNDANGNLSGWAWNDAIGWISFDSATAGSPYTYQVTVNGATGEFSGWAWNDNIGWISFNCDNTSTCGVSDYKVVTSWTSVPVAGNLTSSVFDAGIASGAAINAITWRGNQPSGTGVKFQIASSDSAAGPWEYKGPNGSSTEYYSVAENVPVKINPAHHNNRRYFRYRIFLESDAGKTASPRVDDIIISWSP